jgi:uncharacterized protein YegP (UPF0339 family)
MAYVFEIYKDRKGEFRVRFKASNGETMFSTEGYTSKVSAKNAIKSLLKNAPSATVDDQTEARAAAAAKPAAKARTKKASAKKAPARKPAARRTAKKRG